MSNDCNKQLAFETTPCFVKQKFFGLYSHSKSVFSGFAAINIDEPIKKDILIQEGNGRSTSYALKNKASQN
jgi:hypothetical protein